MSQELVPWTSDSTVGQSHNGLTKILRRIFHIKIYLKDNKRQIKKYLNCPVCLSDAPWLYRLVVFEFLFWWVCNYLLNVGTCWTCVKKNDLILTESLVPAELFPLSSDLWPFVIAYQMWTTKTLSPVVYSYITWSPYNAASFRPNVLIICSRCSWTGDRWSVLTKFRLKRKMEKRKNSLVVLIS